jgi:phage repressor protein C with HTH and peptisase S24 domain
MKKKSDSSESEFLQPLSPPLETLAGRVKSLLGERSAHAFAVKHGIPYTTLQRILQGKTIPKGKQLQAIAQAGEVTVDWLLYGGKKPQPKALDSEVAILELGEENVRIPLINLQVGAGNGYEVMTEEVSEYLTLPRRLIAKERGLNPNSLQAVTVMGDSMSPEFNPGDVVFLDVEKTRPGEGIYIVRLDNAIVIKRMQVLAGKAIKLNSHNPIYEPITIDLETSEESFQILGRVMWSLRKF